MASVLEIQWLCGHSSGLALPFFPCDCCPAVSDLGHIKHPLQRFGVDLAVLFHLLCWHGLPAIDQVCVVALATQDAVIFDPGFSVFHLNIPTNQK